MIIQLELQFDPPTSADLRIPDETHGFLWLVPGSLLAGQPIYEVDEELTARLLAEGGPKEQDQDEIWRLAEAWHANKQGRAA